MRSDIHRSALEQLTLIRMRTCAAAIAVQTEMLQLTIAKQWAPVMAYWAVNYSVDAQALAQRCRLVQRGRSTRGGETEGLGGRRRPRQGKILAFRLS